MSLFLLGTAREQSSRVQNKMTRSFAGSSLYEIYLHKLETIARMPHSFHAIGMAVARCDDILWGLSRDADIPIIERNTESVVGLRRRSGELHFLADMEEDYIMWVNGCMPFLRPETVIEAAVYFTENELKSLTCVKYRYNWFWDAETQKAINNTDSKCVSTQNSPPLLESVHAFHIFNRCHLLNNDSYWGLGSNDPYLYVVNDDMEFMDIDTEADFGLCEVLWNMQRSRL